MVKFCPECGFKLIEVFKFCPECGFELEHIKNNKSAEIQPSVNALKENAIVEKKICDNCGEENDIDNIICSGCGAKLTGAKTGKFPIDSTKQQEKISQPVEPDRQVKKDSAKKISGESKTTLNPKAKSLNKAKTITIIAIGVGVALVISIFSGQGSYPDLFRFN